MTAILILLTIGVAVWFALASAGSRPGAGREPMDSVTQFARAMTALDPAATPPRRRP
jgi:hypothetical protein